MGRLLGEIGTIEWSRRTRGILGRGEKARYLAATVLTASTGVPQVLIRRGRGSGPDPSQLSPPDTQFAREVVDACAELSPMVIEHSYRSYLFARALGIADGIECDEEALFAATMFHDFAFETMDELTDCCFTYAGAEVAAGFLENSPLSDGLRHDVLDAITLHFNPTVGPEQGAVQHLAHDGIVIDVLGLRGWELDAAGVERVAERHPRHGFTVRGVPLLRAHAGRVKGCRVGAAMLAGFAPALKLSPWRAVDQA